MERYQMQQDRAALARLLDRLIDMRRELVDRLAEKLDGGVMALLGSVDSAACAVETEIERRSNADWVAACDARGEGQILPGEVATAPRGLTQIINPPRFCKW